MVSFCLESQMPAYSPYKSRKFIFTLLVILQATGLCVAGLLTGDEWASTAAASLALYAVANVAQKAMVTP